VKKIFSDASLYALTASTRISADYQLIVNPAYNTDRVPVNVFAGRFSLAVLSK
jgi:high affinity Mn2+ porin